MPKIILYYKFVPIADPEAVKLWQKTLTNALNLRGRIIISSDGINGTLGGDIEDIKAYIRANKQFAAFKDIRYKWGEGQGEADFPKMSVRVRDEIVTFGAAGELKVNQRGVIGGGTKIKPAKLNQLLKDKSREVVFFDGRSHYESAVGRFKEAVTPEVRTAKAIPILDSGKYDHLKNKTVVTYCTGGIRCEVLSMLMKNRGFDDVYQLDGGIVKYCEHAGDDGLWEGSLYVFDGRMGLKFSDESKDIGKCIHCQDRTSNYENCAYSPCNDLVLVCDNCKRDSTKLYHSLDCERRGRLAPNRLPA